MEVLQLVYPQVLIHFQVLVVVEQEQQVLLIQVQLKQEQVVMALQQVFQEVQHHMQVAAEVVVDLQ
jgi:hypothetical protein